MNQTDIYTTPSGPVLKWPGAKWRIAEWIIEQMPKHDCYLEPYFATGGVFFNKEPSNVEIINDLDSAVVNLFRVIRNQPEDLAALIALTPWARDEFDNSRCEMENQMGSDLEKARTLLVSMWQSIGVRRASSDEERMAPTGGWRCRNTLDQSPVSTWRRLPDRIRHSAGRLLEAQIENRPALELIERNRHPEVLIYADPPYHPETRNRRLYAHEMTGDDHAQLLEALQAHPGPVLLSGYAHPLYDETLSRWKRSETTTRVQGNVSREEVLWINPVAIQRLEAESDQLQLTM